MADKSTLTKSAIKLLQYIQGLQEEEFFLSAHISTKIGYHVDTFYNAKRYLLAYGYITKRPVVMNNPREIIWKYKLVKNPEAIL